MTDEFESVLERTIEVHKITYKGKVYSLFATFIDKDESVEMEIYDSKGKELGKGKLSDEIADTWFKKMEKELEEEKE